MTMENAQAAPTPVTDAQVSNNPAGNKPLAESSPSVPVIPLEVPPVDSGDNGAGSKPEDGDKKRAEAPGKNSLTQILPNLIACTLGKKATAEVAAEMNVYTNSKRAEKKLKPLTPDKEKTEADVLKLIRENLADVLNETATWRSLVDTLVDELKEVSELDGDLDKRDLKLVVRCANRLKDALDKTSQAA